MIECLIRLGNPPKFINIPIYFEKIKEGALHVFYCLVLCGALIQACLEWRFTDMGYYPLHWSYHFHLNVLTHPTADATQYQPIEVIVNPESFDCSVQCRGCYIVSFLFKKCLSKVFAMSVSSQGYKRKFFLASLSGCPKCPCLTTS